MIGPAPKTFRSLQIEFDLTPREYYAYLHINHFLHSHTLMAISLPWNITQYYSSPTTKTKGISMFYMMLNNKDVFTKMTAMSAWEREIGIAYTPDQ